MNTRLLATLLFLGTVLCLASCIVARVAECVPHGMGR